MTAITIVVIIGGWAGLFGLILRCPQRQGLGTGWDPDTYGMSAWHWVGSNSYRNILEEEPNEKHY